MLNTERLCIYPSSREQMEVMIASEQDEELKKAYFEMLEGCLAHPGEWDWYAMWMLSCRDKVTVLEPERIRVKLYQITSEIAKRYEGERE